MLNKCNEFAEKWRIKFNSNKSNAIVFGKPVIKNVNFYLKDEEIMFKEKLKILGLKFNSKNINENDY